MRKVILVSLILTLGTLAPAQVAVSYRRPSAMLSKFIVLPESATYGQIEEAVTMALSRLNVLVGGDPNVEIVNAERCDNRRDTPRLKLANALATIPEYERTAV